MLQKWGWGGGGVGRRRPAAQWAVSDGSWWCEQERINRKLLQAISAIVNVNMEPNTSLISQPFDTRLVPEYNGTTDVVEWWERARLLCGLRGVPLMDVVPLRLSGGAFAVWSQMPAARRGSLEEVEKTLYAAFAMDSFAAYDAFRCRRLRGGESADVFLSDLRRLAVLFGGVPDSALLCAFVSGLPGSVRQAIRAGSRAESLNLDDVLTRARAVLADEEAHTAAAVVRGPARATTAAAAGATAVPAKCYSCGQPNHIARDCTASRGHRGRGAPRGGHSSVRCYKCNRLGHIASACSENTVGGESSAPASSPVPQ